MGFAFGSMTEAGNKQSQKQKKSKLNHIPDSRGRINCCQRVWPLGQIETIEFVIPNIHKAKLVVGHIVVGSLEECSRYVDIRLRGH